MVRTNKHGIFINGGHPTPEMLAKMKAGMALARMQGRGGRPKSAARIAAEKKSEEVTRWVAEELAKLRGTTEGNR